MKLDLLNSFQRVVQEKTVGNKTSKNSNKIIKYAKLLFVKSMEYQLYVYFILCSYKSKSNKVL